MVDELESQHFGLVDDMLVLEFRVGLRKRVQQNVFEDDDCHVRFVVLQELFRVFEVEQDFAVLFVLFLESLDHEVDLLLLDQVVDAPLGFQVLRLLLACFLSAHVETLLAIPLKAPIDASIDGRSQRRVPTGCLNS